MGNLDGLFDNVNQSVGEIATQVCINVLATAAVIVFQPELRRALEKLGEKNFFSNLVPFERNKENQRFSDETLESLVHAAFEMGSVCTGALIVVEQAIHLTEYELTGIELDCKVSEQVLINIFEHLIITVRNQILIK